MSDRRRAAPSAEARSVADELKLDFVSETADRATRYARRAASAARRRDKLGVHIRLRQARLCLRVVVETLDDRESRKRFQELALAAAEAFPEIASTEPRR
ncbi:MAG TPA: hypothetical protein VKA12_09625 [Roseiarcus sp.]|nr:hypothetical protein [Roseiarcus sp.]